MLSNTEASIFKISISAQKALALNKFKRLEKVNYLLIFLSFSLFFVAVFSIAKVRLEFKGVNIRLILAVSSVVLFTIAFLSIFYIQRYMSKTEKRFRSNSVSTFDPESFVKFHSLKRRIEFGSIALSFLFFIGIFFLILLLIGSDGKWVFGKNYSLKNLFSDSNSFCSSLTVAIFFSCLLVAGSLFYFFLHFVSKKTEIKDPYCASFQGNKPPGPEAIFAFDTSIKDVTNTGRNNSTIIAAVLFTIFVLLSLMCAFLYQSGIILNDKYFAIAAVLIPGLFFIVFTMAAVSALSQVDKKDGRVYSRLYLTKAFLQKQLLKLGDENTIDGDVRALEREVFTKRVRHIVDKDLLMILKTFFNNINHLDASDSGINWIEISDRKLFENADWCIEVSNGDKLTLNEQRIVVPEEIAGLFERNGSASDSNPCSHPDSNTDSKAGSVHVGPVTDCNPDNVNRLFLALNTPDNNIKYDCVFVRYCGSLVRLNEEIYFISCMKKEELILKEAQSTPLTGISVSVGGT